MRDEHKEVRGGIAGEGQGLSEEDESKINEVEVDIDDDGGGDMASRDPEPALQRQQQQQPLGPMIHWERFLPVRSLKVLLVENDDSTRQVVGALLRNCSYEVIAAANGLQAWNILEDLKNHVDLVLTEVVMPCLSGIGLLSKIMNHKTCKNIPVIMMSSNDSMNIVFKCLSKGAVDFLVKPIRKNELKNLWQHVWRRCHSSSGSGSESGIQNQESTKSKSADDSGNNTGSNDEDENGSIGLNGRDGSDNGSGTQSSWTKRAVEIESPQLLPSGQLADPHDSTCAWAIYPKPEKFCDQWVPMTTNKECQDQKELTDNDLMGKDLEIGMANPDAQHVSYPTENASTKQIGASVDKLCGNEQKKDEKERELELESSNASGEPTNQAAYLIGGIAKNTDAQLVVRVAETPGLFSRISDCNDKTIDDPKGMPSLELSLKRLRSTGEKETATHDDRNILKHSHLSAFSRYNTSAASNQVPIVYGGSSAPLDNSSEAMKMESTYNMISISNAALLKQGSIGSSNNNDMGSTTKNVFTKPAASKEKTATTSTVQCIHPFAFSHVQHQTPGTQQGTPEKIDDVSAAAMVAQPRVIQQRVQVQHHHHHYHHHHHHVHSMQQQQQEPDHDDLSLTNMAAPVLQCGSSNVFSGAMEGIAANYSINGSASGSNHGSNGQNGSSTAMNTGVGNMESDNGVIGRSEAGGGTGSGSGSGCGLASNRFMQREAALNKFRQKRKERNFGKKVRYQSRKRLAEQRPRVRGQFVRQACKH